jgi:hypothetical protein
MTPRKLIARVLERALADLASRQWGVAAHYQLVELGFSVHEIQYRLACGRLHQVHLGVYAVGHARLTRHGRWMAAVLAYGPTAVLSHRSAAALWGIHPSSGSLIDVTADRYTRNPRPGLRLHRPRRLDPADVTMLDSIPVTTIARTLMDLAPYLTLERLTRAWDAAVRLEVFDLKQVEELRARSKGRRGLKKIDFLIFQARPLPPRSRSDLEREGYELFANAPDVPTPSANVWIPEAAMEVDLVWAEQRVAVELDHEEWHAKTRFQRERDTARDLTLQKADYKVMRVSDFRLRTDRNGIVQDARDLLRASARA